MKVFLLMKLNILRNIVLFNFVILVFNGCQNHVDKSWLQSQPETLIFRMHAKYGKNDRIWVFYTEDHFQESFPVDTVLTQSISGSNDYQWITLMFPQGIIPERIKIRFSNNREQDTINLKEIQFIKGKNAMRLKGSRLVNYFNFSKYIETRNGRELIFITIDNKYDPNIVSSSALDIDLMKL